VSSFFTVLPSTMMWLSTWFDGGAHTIVTCDGQFSVESWN
jgi:hypothetical protein